MGFATAYDLSNVNWVVFILRLHKTIQLWNCHWLKIARSEFKVNDDILKPKLSKRYMMHCCLLMEITKQTFLLYYSLWLNCVLISVIVQYVSTFYMNIAINRNICYRQLLKGNSQAENNFSILCNAHKNC